jgi:hypothetical protein
MNLGTRQRQATSNEVAIQNERMKVPGVEFACVYSNRSMVEIEGRPAKSYEAVVVGGNEQSIAEVIFQKGPAGVEPFGQIIKEVTDSEGFVWEIGFSRPVNKYIWVMIQYQKNPEEDLPNDVVSAIQDNILAWGQTALNVGVDLIFQRMFRSVYDVQGIGYATISVAVTDDLVQPAPGNYQSQNIEIGETEIAVMDKSRINIQELP